MSWTPLSERYEDAMWEGLKRYIEIDNHDGTVSFQDVTQYSNKQKSFFGANEANRMNKALNVIMTALENGTDLYTLFQSYFEVQKSQFSAAAEEKRQQIEILSDSVSNNINTYFDNLKKKGDADLEENKHHYTDEITAFEATQEQVFITWFNVIKDQLSQDAAGKLQVKYDELLARFSFVEGERVVLEQIKTELKQQIERALSEAKSNISDKEQEILSRLSQLESSLITKLSKAINDAIAAAHGSEGAAVVTFNADKSIVEENGLGTIRTEFKDDKSIIKTRTYKNGAVLKTKTVFDGNKVITTVLEGD